MRLAILFFLTYVVSSPSYPMGQEIVCDGSVSSYSNGLSSQTVDSISFFAERDVLILQSVLPGFPYEFRDAKFSMRREQGLVTLTHPENRLFTGGINRHTGEIFLLVRAEDSVGQLRNTFSGMCRQK